MGARPLRRKSSFACLAERNDHAISKAITPLAFSFQKQTGGKRSITAAELKASTRNSHTIPKINSHGCCSGQSERQRTSRDRHPSCGHYPRRKVVLPSERKEIKAANRSSSSHMSAATKWLPNVEMIVSLVGDHLETKLGSQPQFPIFAEGPNVFFLKVVDAQLEFSKDASGKGHGSHFASERPESILEEEVTAFGERRALADRNASIQPIAE